MMINRGDLSNEQWERLKPLLPPQKAHTGKPNNDHRTVVNGILWILRTGAPWRDLPERYGKWQSVATRFYRWQKAGVWSQVLEQLQAIADEQGKLDWEVHYVDGTVIRAHQHAAGGKKRGAEEEKLGRSRGGFSTKLHIRCEGKGKPITFILSPGQRNESIFLEQLMSQGAVKRPGRGRPRLRPLRLVGDKGEHPNFEKITAATPKTLFFLLPYALGTLSPSDTLRERERVLRVLSLPDAARTWFVHFTF